MSSFDDLYRSLNEQQRMAVDHIDGPMMVLAGAGTGKTQVLAMRIAKLLRDGGVSAGNVLCLTFTESGVAAMRNRLISILGTEGYYVRVYTFHGFCNDVISDFPEKFVTAKELEALTDIERVQTVQKIIDKLSVNNPLKVFSAPYLYLQDILKSISNLKRENVSTEGYAQLVSDQRIFLETVGEYIQPVIEKRANELKEDDIEELISTIDHLGNLSQSVHLYMATSALLQENLALARLQSDGKKVRLTDVKGNLKTYYEKLEKALEKQTALIDVYDKYQKVLRDTGKYDFDDMILSVLNQFQKDRDMLSNYQERYLYMLVDEYQDTNASQNETVRLLGQGVDSPNLFVVGDDDQSIYRFQGASLENVISFYQLYKDSVKVVCLTDNYRSQQAILDVAGSVIDRNVYRVTTLIPEITKKLTGHRESVTSVQINVAEFEMPMSELYWIAKDIDKKIERGINPAEIAVLYRNNRNAEDLIDIFDRMQIPYVLESGQDILQDIYIRQLVQLLKCVHDPYEDVVLHAVLHYSFLGFSVLDLLKITRYLNTHRKPSHKRYSYFEMISSTERLSDAEVSDIRSFIDFSEKLVEWNSACANETICACVERILRDSGLFDYVMTKVNSVELLNRLYTFLEIIKEENRKQKGLDYEGLLVFFADHQLHEIPIYEKELPSSQKAVHLMTAHRSKGLEFEYVYIMQVVDKVWGNSVNRDKIVLPSSLLKYDLAAVRRDANEDERRLFYVALTRAKDEIVISYSRKRGDGKEQFPSMFLSEIDRTHVTNINTSAIEEQSGETLKAMFIPKLSVDHDSETKQYLQGVLADYEQRGFSVTHLNNYLKCPRLFYYQNFIKIPVLKNKHMALGTASHTAIEELYKSKVDAEHKGSILSKEQLLKKFERALEREILNDQDHADSLEQGREFLSQYYDHYSVDLPQNIFIEYDFASHNVCLGDIPLTGKLDLVHVLDGIARTVEVVDFKTGNSDNKAAMFRFGGDYHRQIVFYQLLCNLSKRFGYRMIRGVIDFVQPMKSGSFLRETISVSEEDLAHVQEEIREVWQKIHNLEFNCLDETGTCEHCERVLVEARED